MAAKNKKEAKMKIRDFHVFQLCASAYNEMKFPK